MIVAIIFFSILIIAGGSIFFTGASARFYWAEVRGSIIAFNEYITWHNSQDDEPSGKVSYIPIIEYTVKDNVYSGSPKRNRTWTKPDFTKEVIVLYNPEEPKEFYLKDGMMSMGCLLMVIGVIAIGILIVYNLKG